MAARARRHTASIASRYALSSLSADDARRLGARDRITTATSVTPQRRLRITGSGGNRHAYWPLTAPLAPAALERANRRIAAALGADVASIDAARVLRPPGGLNFKTDPPGFVRLDVFTGERFDTSALIAALPGDPVKGGRSANRPARPAPRRVEDPLRSIDPDVYVAALTGRQPGRDRKVSCPFHRDRTPSLHAYETPEDGWFCFGCRRGGSLYDLGAGVMGLSTRGREFVELRTPSS